ncbi:hypothetical protein Tco_1119217 [Tanacetum coccineum]
MVKAKRNKLSLNFKKAAEQKFKEYDQKLEALSKINVPEAIEESVQAKVMSEMKKQRPTHVPKAIANYVKHRLKNIMLEVIKRLCVETSSKNLVTASKCPRDGVRDSSDGVKVADIKKPKYDSTAETLKKGSPFAPDSEPPLRPYKLWKKARYEEAFRKSSTNTYDEHLGNVDKTKDEVGNPCPQSTPQAPPSFDVYTPHVTYPKEVDKTLGTPMEDEPLDQMKLEHVGLNNHSIFVSSKEVPSFDEPEPQPNPLPNCPSLDISLGGKRGPESPIKSHSRDSFRMKMTIRNIMDLNQDYKDV